jgi:ribonuclease PH
MEKRQNAAVAVMALNLIERHPDSARRIAANYLAEGARFDTEYNAIREELGRIALEQPLRSTIDLLRYIEKAFKIDGDVIVSGLGLEATIITDAISSMTGLEVLRELMAEVPDSRMDPNFAEGKFRMVVPTASATEMKMCLSVLKRRKVL